MARIEDEINQRSFRNEYLKAKINIVYTALMLNSELNTLLKPYNISMQQYNVLRILRGAHPKPISIKLITSRMLDKMSNASRLVEKLRKKGLVERTPSEEDKRRADVIITQQGLDLLDETIELTEEHFIDKIKVVGPEKVAMLNDILDTLRG